MQQKLLIKWIKQPIPQQLPKFPSKCGTFLKETSVPRGFVNPKEMALPDLRKRVNEINLRPTVPLEQLLASVNRIKPAALPIEKLPEDIKESVPRTKTAGFDVFTGSKSRFTGSRFPG